MSVLVFIGLLLFTAAWFLLALVPALRELYRPTDDAPLTMVGYDAGDLTVFANGFRAYLARQLPISVTGRTWHSEVIDALRDGTPVAQLNGRPALLDEIMAPERTVNHLVLAGSPLRLPGDETFLLELYARSDFVGGPDAAYRAVLAESDAELGERSSVMRWVHAEGILTARASTRLPGRASAGREIVLHRGVTFARLRAPRIVTGEIPLALPDALPPLLTSSFKLPSDAKRLRTFVRILDDVTLRDGETFVGNLVIEGTLTLGSGARIAGSVKVHGAVVLGDNAVIDGALVSRDIVEIGRGGRLGGPLIAERHLTLGRGSSVGRKDLPATVAAGTLIIDEGCQVFGAIAARERGLVGTPEAAHARARAAS
jgi:hypothetical protein